MDIWDGKMKEKIINIFKLFFSFLLFAYLSTIISYVLSLFGIDITKFGLLGKTLFNLFISIFLTMIVIVTYYKDLKNNFLEFKANWKSKVMFTLKLFAIFMLIKLLSGYVSVIISETFNIEQLTSENQTAINEILGKYPILMTFSAVCLAPIYEEVLFRLGFRKCINNKWIFIIVSGSLFGLIHIFPTDLSLGVALTQSITYITMGLVLAYYYHEFNNIFYSIIIHFYNNLLSIIFILISFIVSLF